MRAYFLAQSPASVLWPDANISVGSARGACVSPGQVGRGIRTGEGKTVKENVEHRRGRQSGSGHTGLCLLEVASGAAWAERRAQKPREEPQAAH